MGALHALREVNNERDELTERNKYLEVRVRELEHEVKLLKWRVTENW